MVDQGFSSETPENGTVAVAVSAATAEGTMVEVGLSSCYPCRCIRRNRLRRLNRIYHDADDGRGLQLVDNEDPFMDQSLHYFDALEEEMTSEELYPIITTSYRRRNNNSNTKISFDNPETMLRHYHHIEDDNKKSDSESNDEDDRGLRISDINDGPKLKQNRQKQPKQQQQRKSSRLMNILRRSTLGTKKLLTTPRVKIMERGFPGGLSVEELAIAQRFVRELKTRNVACAEQVFSFRDVEEEPYAICRWLRGFKFDADKALQRLDNQIDSWNNAKSNHFYPNVSEALGAPFSVFLTQYPFIAMGNAKNGCPVNYFRAGRIHPEGILCLTTASKVEGYFWHNFAYTFIKDLKRAQSSDPNFVCCEGINVVDLEGLSASAVTKDALECVTLAGKVADFYPETQHCMIIINAPSFFTFLWPAIKKLIDPRTASRIQVFSDKKKSSDRLKELIDSNEIPIDYGGNPDNPDNTIAHAVIKQGGLDTEKVKRQEVQLLYIKKRSTIHHEIHLQKNEAMKIIIYTRSISNASFVVSKNQTDKEEKNNKDVDTTDTDKVSTIEVVVEADISSGDENRESSPPLPSQKVMGTIYGPGHFDMHGQDLDTATRKQSSFSRGYYLFVGTVI